MLVVAPGDAADVVERRGAGVSGRARAMSRSIAAAVVALSSQMSSEELADMGRRGPALYESLMARHVGAPRLQRS